jgi:uncharacterized protein (DUF2384 family)
MTTKEIYDYGLIVFNNEKEKFERWLLKNNSYLGFSPKEKLKTKEGKKEVKRLLDIIEYGEYSN